MTPHTTPAGGPDFSTAESALPIVVNSKEAAPVPLPGEKSTGSDESPVETDSSGEVEFKEGGYGWLVHVYTQKTLALPGSNVCNRVVVFSVLLINAHTWGLNSSYAVFLAYYLRSGTIEGSSALGFAFVGGLSISICQPFPLEYFRCFSLTVAGQPF